MPLGLVNQRLIKPYRRLSSYIEIFLKLMIVRAGHEQSAEFDLECRSRLSNAGATPLMVQWSAMSAKQAARAGHLYRREICFSATQIA